MRSELIAMILCLSLAGCTRSLMPTSVVDGLPAPSPGAVGENDLDFWQQLETQRVMTNNDALHGLFLLSDGVDPNLDYVSRAEAAKKRHWIGPNDDHPANESIRIGTVAVAVCDILDVKGGFTMWVFGSSKRYCTRELVYQQILPVRSEEQAITGLEFLNLVGRVEDRLGHNDNKRLAGGP